MDSQLLALLLVCSIAFATVEGTWIQQTKGKKGKGGGGGIFPYYYGGRGNFGSVMSPTYYGNVYGTSGNAYGGSANAFATLGSTATAFGGTAVTGPGVGPMTASGIGTGYTSGYSNVGVGDDYYGRGRVYGIGAPGFSSGFMGAPGFTNYYMGGPGIGGGFMGTPGYSSGLMGTPGYSGGLMGTPGYSSGFVGAPGMGMVGNAGLYSGGLGMGQIGTPGLAGGLGYMTGGAGMGGIGGQWVAPGFYFFPFPGFCPSPSTPVFRINKRWWYCRIWYYKKR